MGFYYDTVTFPILWFNFSHLFELQNLEIVPLYGDMQIHPYIYLRNCPNFDPSKWPCCESSAPSPQSNLLINLEAIKDDHMQYISQLARHSNEATTTTREVCILNLFISPSSEVNGPPNFISLCASVSVSVNPAFSAFILVPLGQIWMRLHWFLRNKVQWFKLKFHGYQLSNDVISVFLEISL